MQVAAKFVRERAATHAALAAAAYAAIAAVPARGLFQGLGRSIVSDDGDPVFVASILAWNAAHLPLSGPWWQFPIFAPTANALAFSEHLLGLAPLSTPLLWITGDAIATYNLLLLFTYPLCGIAMFALVRRLTASSAAGFVAGLAFAFAPFRASHLPHLHVLAAFWAPLALLGLHAYLDSRRPRWLVLYGLAFLLQAATNGYMLVFLSIVVGLWTVWFVVVPRRWAALAAIAAATLAGLAPLAPIVVKYLSVHAQHAFSRDVGEMRSYSADLAGILCAPQQLAFWGWLRTGCRPEGELFPGVATAVLAALGAWRCTVLEPGVRLSTVATLISRAALALATLFAGAALSVVVAGPWAMAIGPLRVSASSIAKPVMTAAACLLASVALSPRVRVAARSSSVPGFYAVAAIATWALALGPVVIFLNQPRAIPGPFALLLDLPGVGALRVPARLWLLTTICLAVLVGYFVAAVVAHRRRGVVVGTVALCGLLLLADGWIDRFPAMPAPSSLADGIVPPDALVLTLPMHTSGDIAAAFQAVAGGWRAVNGYSGYFPRYYFALTDAASAEIAAAVGAFAAQTDLHVLVAGHEPLARHAVEKLPGAVLVAERPGTSVFRLPRRRSAAAGHAAGPQIPIARIQASCDDRDARHVTDGDRTTRWHCGPRRTGQELVLDLERTAAAAAVTLDLGDYVSDYPRWLEVDTSLDGATWDNAWSGSVRELLISQAVAAPGPSLRVSVPLASPAARYLRLRETAPGTTSWSIAELEVRAR